MRKLYVHIGTNRSCTVSLPHLRRSFVCFQPRWVLFYHRWSHVGFKVQKLVCFHLHALQSVMNLGLFCDCSPLFEILSLSSTISNAHWYEVSLRQIFSEYCSSPCQFSSHQLLYIHQSFSHPFPQSLNTDSFVTQRTKIMENDAPLRCTRIFQLLVNLDICS